MHPHQLRHEVIVKIDLKTLLNRIFGDPSDTEPFLNYAGAYRLVFRLNIAPEYRQTPCADFILPRAQLAVILREGVSDVADRADAESQQVCLAVGCVPLKVPMQRTVVTCGDQRVAGPRKV